LERWIFAAYLVMQLLLKLAEKEGFVTVFALSLGSGNDKEEGKAQEDLG
jgi:hypothetical protein